MIRRLFFRSLYSLGIVQLIHFINKRLGRFPILVFHRVSPHEDPFWAPITPESFEKTLNIIRQHYNILVLENIFNYSSYDLKNGCFITFDDAFEDTYTWARPLLLKYSVPASFFVPTQCLQRSEVVWQLKLRNMLRHTKASTIRLRSSSSALDTLQDRLDVYQNLLKQLSRVDRDEFEKLFSEITRQIGAYDDENVRIMSMNQIYELTLHFGIHSHTRNHHQLTALTRSQISEEIKESLEDLKKWLPYKSRFLAYPVGDYNQQVIDETAIFYDAAFEVGERLVKIDRLKDPQYRMKIPRFNIHHNSPFEVYACINGFHSFVKFFRRSS